MRKLESGVIPAEICEIYTQMSMDPQPYTPEFEAIFCSRFPIGLGEPSRKLLLAYHAAYSLEIKPKSSKPARSPQLGVQNPDAAEVYYERAFSYVSSGDHDRAMESVLRP